MDRELQVRTEVMLLNQELPKNGLVTMHSGNVSVYAPDLGKVFIKPSGMDYDKITPEAVVAVDFATGTPSGKYRASVDLTHHLFLYRNMPNIRSVIHTHSNHATAFAACHKPLPLCLTAIADEFGGEVPCAPYVGNEGDEIGKAILEHCTEAPAILLGNHGVFTWGETGKAALKAAVMVEDVAKTLYLAYQIGTPVPLPREEVLKWHDRYLNRYGQKAA